MISKIKTATAALALLALAGCSLTGQQYDLPSQVVEWSEENVYLVGDNRSFGSGFWINSTTLLTACHVVRSRKELPVKSFDGLTEYMVDVATCDKKLDVAILKTKAGEYKAYHSPVTINTSPLSMGKGVWGSGYGFGIGLYTTSGHYQGSNSLQPGTMFITAATVMGDSGSPVLALENGILRIVGMRLSVAAKGYVIVPHLVGISTGKDLQDHLDQYNVVE